VKTKDDIRKYGLKL